MKLYLSYGATGQTKLRKGEPLAPEDWFIIQPYDGPMAEMQRERLSRSRAVIEVEVPDGNPRDPIRQTEEMIEASRGA